VTQPAQCWHIDHKPLTRKTTQGNVAILVFVCAFSNWPILRAVKDMSAKTTADTFFKEVIAAHVVPTAIMTDRGSAFSSAFFTHLADLLHIKHRMSASQAARSNGLAESVVKRVSELAKIYVDDDTDIESSLPLMEMALRGTAHTQLLISPFELMHGREMNEGQPLTPSFTGDHLQYFEQLTKKLTELHKQVSDNRREVKELYKRDYDKRNKVAKAPWTVGHKIVLLNKRIPLFSNQVLSHRPYNGPWFIGEVVKGDSGIGASYRLINVKTGKPYKFLVSADRLKAYTADKRIELVRRFFLTNEQKKEGSSENQQMAAEANEDRRAKDAVTNNKSDVPDCEPAVKVLKQRKNGNITEYLVLFRDGSRHWCDYITPALFDYYQKTKQKRRNRKRS